MLTHLKLFESSLKLSLLSAALGTLSERLQGPYDLEMIIFDLDVKISTAVMEFQNQGHKITQSVFEECGTVRTAKREAFSEDIEFEDQIPDEAKIDKIKDFSTAKDLVKANSRRSDFDKLVNEVRKISGDSLGFWRNLPYIMCDQPNPEFQEQLFGKSEAPVINNDQCWNGRDSGPYKAEIVQDGLAHISKNPEIEIVQTEIIEPMALKTQGSKLLVITEEIRSAHNGQDVVWWDDVSTRFPISFLEFSISISSFD